MARWPGSERRAALAVHAGCDHLGVAPSPGGAAHRLHRPGPQGRGRAVQRSRARGQPAAVDQLMAGLIHGGSLRKMAVAPGEPARYALPLGEESVPLNPFLGQEVRLQFRGAIHCIHCGRKSSKSFNQGYCYPCFRSLARCDTCIVRPELCHYFEGTCREPEWGDAHCMIPHIVYLANSTGTKVGITRHTQLPPAGWTRAPSRPCPSSGCRPASSRVWWKACFATTSAIAPTGGPCCAATWSR